MDETKERRRARSYDTYPEAQQAVDRLSDKGFPVQRLSIVAEELRLVENVTGRRDYGAAAAQGLLSGTLVGALIGFVFGLFNLVDPLVSALALASFGVIFGAVVGTLFGVVTQFAGGGGNDFSSTGRILAGRYDLVADDEVAAEAASLLDETSVMTSGLRG
jgi:hypothetical protein